MLNPAYILLAIVIIALTIIGLLKKTKLCNLVYYSNRQTQMSITNQTLQELDQTATELQHLGSTINRLSTGIDRIHKDIDTIYCNVAAQQPSLDLLNKYTSENLQTIVNAVHQLVHIAQNIQDNIQTFVQKNTKFQEMPQANILLGTEPSRRNSR